MDKVKSTLFPASAGEGGDDSVPWWMKYAGKAAGIIGGGVAMVFGVLCCITFSPMCLVAGIWQIVAGFVVIVIEAPFCCMFLDFVQKFSAFADGRPPWQKSLLYLVLALPPLCVCFQLSTILGSGLIAATAALYGAQMVGKKASQSDMAQAARGNPQPDETNIMDDAGDWQNNP